MATPSKNRSNTSGLRTKTHSSRNRSRAAFRPQKYNQYAFLTEPIKEIAYPKSSIDSIFGGSIDWESNLPYIIASAKRWCELHGKPYKVENDDGNPVVTVGRIYRYLSALTDEYRFDIDYVEKEERLKIIEYRYCDFPEYTIFYLPAKYINSFEGEMREIMLRFVSFVFYNTLYCFPEDSYDFSMLYDIPFEEEEDTDIIKMIKSYKDGEANDLFEEIIGVPKENRTKEAILELIEREEANLYDTRLLSCLKKGLDLMTQGNLTDFAYFDGYCSDERFDTRFESSDKIMPERLFIITYGMCDDKDDQLASYACHSLSEDSNNLEVNYFRDGRHLSPDDKDIFEPSTYPSEWADWFGEFIDFMYEPTDE